MKRRKNADDKIRKLERAAASGIYEDVAAYWRACLKANQLPKHTLDFGDPVWEIEKEVPSNGWFRYMVCMSYDDTDPDESTVYGVHEYLDRRYVTSYRFESQKAAEHQVKLLLKDRLTKVNPIRKNADDNLRRLERLSQATQDPSDIAAYWLACLRAGIVPTETTRYQYSKNDYKRIWTLYPIEYQNSVVRGGGKMPYRMIEQLWPEDVEIYGLISRDSKLAEYDGPLLGGIEFLLDHAT